MFVLDAITVGCDGSRKSSGYCVTFNLTMDRQNAVAFYATLGPRNTSNPRAKVGLGWGVWHAGQYLYGMQAKYRVDIATIYSFYM